MANMSKKTFQKENEAKPKSDKLEYFPQNLHQAKKGFQAISLKPFFVSDCEKFQALAAKNRRSAVSSMGY
jgi:hypothetical protein